LYTGSDRARRHRCCVDCFVTERKVQKAGFLRADTYIIQNMFTRLFKPKWEHPDPRTRCQALESEDVPPEVLATAAREDQDPVVRRCAVERLSDLELLAMLLASEPLSDIREAAGRRQREVLAGPLHSGPPLAVRLQAMARAASPELCTRLARDAQAAEIRVAALQQVNDTDVLCVIAVDDPVASVRRAALERIDDPQGWEVVARDARNKDKQISRMARERLDVHRKSQADREIAERLCADLEALATGVVQAGSRQHFLRLTSVWDQLGTQPAPLLGARFARARRQVAAAIEHFNAVLADRQSLCADLESLLGNLKESAERDAVPVPDLQERLQQANARWQALIPPAADDDPLARRFADLIRQIQNASERLAMDQARSVPLRALVQQADELLAADTGELDERRVTGLERRWEALERPSAPELTEVLQQEFDSRRDRLRERLKQQAKQRRQALEEAESLIAGMDGVLKEGELERALSQRDRVRHLLKIAGSCDERKRASLQARLQRLHPRLEQLRQWRHWGSGNARDRLCAELETLAGSVLPAAELATRVRTAREAWKRIDRGEGPAREDLWRRFDQACSQAYAPYQQERREQAERLAAHLARKQALCRELDAFERDTDWKTVDWRAADRMVRSANERWRRIGPVPAKARKSLEKDYRAVLGRLESHLETERERELRRRRALIARVEQLSTASDLRSAIRETREAQESWSPAVQAGQEQEQQLWKAFRQACDAVFSKAKEEHAAADTERQANLDRKQALCAELEALLDSTEVGIHDLTQRFAAAAGEWRGIGALPRQQERAVEARYEALGKRLAKRRQQASKAAEQALLQGIRERSRLCERLETAVLENNLEEVGRTGLAEDTRRSWEALTPLDASQVSGLQQRFELACRALAGEPGTREELLDALPRNLARRLELCLQMEVAAGLDSPAEFGEARLRLQVSRLADALSHRQEGAVDGAGRLRELLLDWYQTGPAPVVAHAGLAARVERVIAATG
jgi:exonuclease SbcC